MDGRRALWISLALVVLVGSATLSVCSGPAASAAKEPSHIPNIIIDTDLSRWWDDATAVGMANVLQQRGKVHVLGIMSDIPNPVAVAAIDAIGSKSGKPSESVVIESMTISEAD